VFDFYFISRRQSSYCGDGWLVLLELGFKDHSPSDVAMVGTFWHLYYCDALLFHLEHSCKLIVTHLAHWCCTCCSLMACLNAFSHFTLRATDTWGTGTNFFACLLNWWITVSDLNTSYNHALFFTRRNFRYWRISWSEQFHTQLLLFHLYISNKWNAGLYSLFFSVIQCDALFLILFAIPYPKRCCDHDNPHSTVVSYL